MTQMKNYEFLDAHLSKEMSLEEEYEFYNEVLDRVIKNPRFYLEHLDDGTLTTFKCSFINYHKKRRLYK